MSAGTARGGDTERRIQDALKRDRKKALPKRHVQSTQRADLVTFYEGGERIGLVQHVGDGLWAVFPGSVRHYDTVHADLPSACLALGREIQKMTASNPTEDQSHDT
jgi:hypothetical protein